VTAPAGDVLAGLEDGARQVLDANWIGESTLPSRTLYPHQWSWDSAFMALGRSWYDEAKAQQELRSLFRAQWADGRVPHIVFNPAVAEDAYFPGPAFWQSSTRSSKAPRDVETSGITQPPIHARAALEMHRHTRDADGSRAFLAWLYPRLAAQAAYLDGPRTLALKLHQGGLGIEHIDVRGSAGKEQADHVLRLSPGEWTLILAERGGRLRLPLAEHRRQAQCADSAECRFNQLTP